VVRSQGSVATMLSGLLSGRPSLAQCPPSMKTTLRCTCDVVNFEATSGVDTSYKQQYGEVGRWSERVEDLQPYLMNKVLSSYGCNRSRSSGRAMERPVRSRFPSSRASKPSEAQRPARQIMDLQGLFSRQHGFESSDQFQN